MKEVAFLYDRNGAPHSVAVAATRAELLDYIYDWPGYGMPESTVTLWTDEGFPGVVPYEPKHRKPS